MSQNGYLNPCHPYTLPHLLLYVFATYDISLACKGAYAVLALACPASGTLDKPLSRLAELANISLASMYLHIKTLNKAGLVERVYAAPGNIRAIRFLKPLDWDNYKHS